MSESKSPLRVGVIGLGGISRSQHLPYWKQCPHSRVVAIADVNPRSLSEVASEYEVHHAYADWRHLIARDDLDIVDIATPNALHAPMAIAALEAGKHVLCEKPMATAAADAERMLSASEKAGKLLMINHCFRFSSILNSMRTYIAQNTLGDIYNVHARWVRRRGVPVSPTFMSKDLAVGGPIFDLGVHMLDLACWMMDFPKAVRVCASVGTHLAGRSDIGGNWGDWDPKKYEVEDFGLAMLHFANGASMIIEVSWLGFYSSMEERSLRILGTKGGLHWPDGIIVSEANRIPVDTHLASKDDGNVFQRSIEAFVDAIRTGAPSPIPPTQTLSTVRILEAVYRSAQEKREITLD